MKARSEDVEGRATAQNGCRSCSRAAASLSEGSLGSAVRQRPSAWELWKSQKLQDEVFVFSQLSDNDARHGSLHFRAAAHLLLS